MSTVQHTACRTAVAEDRVDESVAAHLEGCPGCARFAEDVRRITGVAPSLTVPSPPDGLAERVLARVAAERGPQPMRSRPLLTPSARRSLTISGAVAAAVLLVLGTLALASGRGDDDADTGPKQVLLAAAERTEEAGSASVSVEGETEVVLPAPSEDDEPDFDAAPPELADYMSRQWARTMAQFEAHLREFEERTNEALRRGQEQIERGLEEANRRMEEALERMGRMGEPGEPPEPPEPPEPTEPSEPGEPPAPSEEPPPRPRDVSVRLAVSGSGTVDFDSRVLLDGAIRPVGTGTSAQAQAQAQAGFQLAVQDGQAALRGPDGQWASVAEAEGPLASVLLRPGAVALVLRAAEGDVSVAGEEQGARRYRFRVDPRALGRSELSGKPWTAEATIGEDGRVQALRVQSTGTVDRRSGLAWNTDLRLRLGNFGTAVGERPAAAARPGRTVAAEGRSSLILHPFGATAAASLRAAER